MVEAMKIQKYLDEFHDGALIDIQYSDNELILSIESSEMDVSDMKDEIALSERGTIKGKMHLKGIKLIKINSVHFIGFLEKKYDSGKIVDLQIAENNIMIAISWVNFPPKPSVNDFSTIEIKADTIWWENIPDLFDPFW